MMSLTAYPVKSSNRYEKVIPEGGGMLLVGDNGKILNPIGLNDSIINDAVSSKIKGKRILDGQLQKIVLDEYQKIKRKRELGRAVSKILAQDEDYQEFHRLKRKQDKLKSAADSHFDWLLHSYWEVKGLGDVGFDEPPKGEFNPEADAEYRALSNEMHATRRSKKRSALTEAKKKLGSMHEDYMSSLRRR